MRVTVKPYWATNDGATVRLYHGHVIDVLRGLPERSVHMVATSPPYWGLRDYGDNVWTGGSPECDHIERMARNDVSPERLAERAALYTTGQQGGSKVKPIQYKGTCPRCGARRVDGQVRRWPDGLVGALGAEPTPQLFVTHTVAWMREVRRVLRDDGSVWLNLGSSYCSGSIVVDEDETLVLRDDLTPDELEYVLSEIMSHLRQSGKIPIPG